MIKKACDSGSSEKVMQFSDFKENSLTKKTDGKRKISYEIFQSWMMQIGLEQGNLINVH